MLKTRSQRYTDGSKGNERGDPQNPRQDTTPGDKGAELSRIPPEQLVRTVVENLPTFEAIMNYLKEQTGEHQEYEPKERRRDGIVPSESRMGSTIHNRSGNERS